MKANKKITINDGMNEIRRKNKCSNLDNLDDYRYIYIYIYI